MRRDLRRIAVACLLLLAIGPMGGCDLKEAFCAFLNDACGDPRPSDIDGAEIARRNAAPTTVAFRSRPSSVVAGEYWDEVVVVLLNDFGYEVTPNKTYTLRLSHNGSSGFIAGSETMTTTTSSRTTFSPLRYPKAETLELTVSSPELDYADSTTVTVIPAEPHGLAIVAEPQGTQTAGETWPALSVAVVDEYGNLSRLAGLVTELSLQGGNGTLSGATTVDVVDGFAVFSEISYDVAETVQVVVTEPDYSLESAPVSVTVGPGPAMQLVFNVPDGTTTQVNQPISVITLTSLDSLGNHVSVSGVDVTLSHNGAGTLSAFRGDLVRPLVNGRVVYDDLSYENIEVFDLFATAEGFEQASVLGFSVEAGPSESVGTVLINRDSSGAFIESSAAHISADGRYVTFSSFREIHTSYGSFFYDLYRYDVVTGASEMLLDAAADLEVPDLEDLVARPSSDGRIVAYYGYFELPGRLHDAASGEVISLGQRISASVSASGRYVFAPSETGQSSILDPWMNEVHQIVPAIGLSGTNVGISTDGRYLTIQTTYPLSADDTNVNLADCYAIDRDSDEDGIYDEIGATSARLLSVASDGAAADASCKCSSVSRTGRFLLFGSAATTLDSRTSDPSIPQLYVHDRDVSNDGTFDEPGDVSTSLVSVTPAGNLFSDVGTLGFQISDDGRFVLYRDGWPMMYILDRDLSGDGAFDEVGDTAIELVSTDLVTGEPRFAASGDLSADGRFVIYPQTRSGENPRGVNIFKPNPLYPFPAP